MSQIYEGLKLGGCGSLSSPSPDCAPCYLTYRSSDLGEYGFPIPTGQGWGMKIWTELISLDISKRNSYVPNTAWPKFIRSEVFRFYQSLVAYFDSPNPVMSYQYLVNLVLEESDAIPKLKRIRALVVLNSYGGDFVEGHNQARIDYPDYARFKIRDIGDVFNVRYFLFFDQEDPHDEETCFIPLPTVLKEDYDLFEETCYQMLPDIPINPVLEEEILLSLSGSSGKDRSGKSNPVWSLKEKENHFSDKPLVGHISYIQKCPGDTRNSIVLSVPHSNSIKLIEKQVALIAAEVYGSNYVKDHDTYFKRYDKFGLHNNYFYCRDTKKDGLTKNRRLVQLVLMAIEKKYPGLPCNKYKGIFDSFTLVCKGKPDRQPPRGVGLGMTSAITTIIQSVIFRITLDAMADDNWFDAPPIEALFYHDDTAFGSPSKEAIENFVSYDIDTCERFGIIASASKSFTAPWFVLCENYSIDALNKKESYQRIILRQPFVCVNVTHAKLMFKSVLQYIEPGFEDKYLAEYVSFWGYEFFPTEENVPALFGGWVPARFGNLDVSFLACGLEDKRVKAASLAQVIVTPPAYKSEKVYPKTKYTSPVEQVYGSSLSYGDHAKDYFTDETHQSMAVRFRSFKKLGDRTKFFGHLQDKRQEAFLSGLRLVLDIKEWYYKLLELHPYSDIFPPKDILLWEDCSKYPVIDRLYKPTNPFMQYLKFCNPKIFSDLIIPWPLPPSVVRDTGMRLSAWDRLKIESIFNQTNLWTLLGSTPLLVKPETRHIVTESWYDTGSLVTFCNSYFGFDKIPIIPSRKGLRGLKDYSHDLFRLSHPDHPGLLEYLANRIGYSKVKNLDLTYFEDEALGMIRRKHAEELLIARRHALLQLEEDPYQRSDLEISSNDLESEFNWSDTPLNDYDFFTWQTSSKNYRDWRNQFFSRIDMVYNQILMEHSLDAVKIGGGPSNFNIHWVLGETEQYLYKASGGQIDEFGQPVVIITDFFGSDPKKGVDGETNLGSDSDSMVGMMAGWAD